ncbi:hypothetical protein BDY19DRAFT_1048081 [Irpex rosettiformis]|uniref:Uncharacterized protein n=1 Tax=Irpex rosettiformis TaxID=378272 RepID=A0ACB8U4R7_9APHY|nr:hypothetical protein BDY19DRAFT_1048081 [Irpex rosettiformis]
MAPYYSEVEYDVFMSSYVKISANDVTSNLSLGRQELQSYTKDVNEGVRESPMYEQLPETPYEDVIPSLAMYPDTDQAKQAFSRDMDTPTEAIAHRARVAWAWMTIAVEIKHDANLSAFYFDSRGSTGYLRNTVEGRKAQAQFVEYAAQIMARQHRTFVFLLYICENNVRLTRWDRVGCIVSEPIDFEAEPEKVLNFIYRLALMSDKELGYDTTAILATPEEVEQLAVFFRPNEYARECAAEILAPQTQVLHPIYKITCKNINGTEEGVYYIRKDRTASQSPMGPATRGYIMFIQDSYLLGFLKDYWQPHSDGKVPWELDIYMKLKAAGVRHVATAIGGGEVKDGSGSQMTITDNSFNAPLKLEHCRIALKEFARPLEDYENSKGLITIVSHALEGHDNAWNKAKILHRDISVNNIMFVVAQDEETTREMNGILIDWDLCKERDELNNNRTQNGRSGTWAFMSTLSLLHPLKPNDLADDLESFIHVITYYSLRFHRHTMTRSAIKSASEPISEEALASINGLNTKLGKYVFNFYLDYDVGEDGLNRGGGHKRSSARGGELDWWFTDAVPALNYLVTSLYVLLKKHYKQVDFASLRKKYSTLPVPPEQVSSEQGRGSNSSVVDNSGPISLAEGPKWHTDELDVTISGPEQMNEPAKGLNSHQEIMGVFKEAIRRLNNEEKYTPDKTQDQFLRLCVIYYAAPHKVSSNPTDTRLSGNLIQWHPSIILVCSQKADTRYKHNGRAGDKQETSKWVGFSLRDGRCWRWKHLVILVLT